MAEIAFLATIYIKIVMIINAVDICWAVSANFKNIYWDCFEGNCYGILASNVYCVLLEKRKSFVYRVKKSGSKK